MSTQRLLALTFCSLVAGICAAAGGNDFGARLALVKEAGLGDAFANVAVKAERPMPWPAFADLRYREFKGGGKPAEGELGRDRDAAIWLAVLDDDYRCVATYVEGRKVYAR